jgi:hypothetical protein
MAPRSLFGTASSAPISQKKSKPSNPLHINFHEYAEMLRDVKQAKTLREKLFFIFGDPIKIAQLKEIHASSEALRAIGKDQQTDFSELKKVS